ncbi:LytTR family two component transcriptional regulator [Hydrogenispora ethanolica]|uniref:LytTR family two component transcriptional regulator n=1 Tax=Hydrogenispora ethanolica TaxID=1082276 RepID=A0A4R1RD58_HYDET|nr:LytTR family DNA-binding domain-containing protein [Hydrogenispora ethanolica]TCL63805.1 LytTR family two component transcriptional regulator [Hydrogenispora ethanolica]
MILKTLIVDFPAEIANELKTYLENLKELDCSGEICTMDKSLEWITLRHPDIVFIHLGANRHRVLEITRKIAEIAEAVRVVWLAENAESAVDAFELNVYDYLLKPLRAERLLKTVNRLAGELRPAALEAITVWENDRFVVLKPEQIVYCYTSGNKTLIKSKDGQFSSMNTLSSFEQKLGRFSFFRTHKSFLVNLKDIKEIIPWFNHTYNLVMNGYESDEVPVSRTHLKDFKQRMGIH